MNSDWQKKDGLFRWNITVPFNASATVFVPAKAAEGVTENDKPASQQAGVQFLRIEQGRAVFRVGSGGYSFQSAAF